MSLKRRLKKIEDSVGEKNKDSAPLVIICKDEEDKEKKLNEYYAKYGEGAPYEGNLILIMLPQCKDNKETLLDKLTKNNDSEQKEAGNDGQTEQIE